MADSHTPRMPLCSISIPVVGLGCWQSPPGEVEKSVEWALDAGVRLIDSAYMYMNEREIGSALAKCIESAKVRREDLFVVTKLPTMAMHPEDVGPFFEMSRRALGLDYVDLYLIHSPVGVHKDSLNGIKFYNGKVMFDKETDHVAIWREMEKLVESGKCRAIGVSNFSGAQLERISKIAKFPIAVNQVECNAFFQQKKLRETMDRLNIKMMAYAPLGSPGRDPPGPKRPPIQYILNDEVVASLAKKHNKTPAQILLRHLVQLGFVVFPKSVNRDRITENFDIFDFSLSDDDMMAMDKLDRGSKARSFDFSFLPCHGDPTELPEFPYASDEY